MDDQINTTCSNPKNTNAYIGFALTLENDHTARWTPEELATTTNGEWLHNLPNGWVCRGVSFTKRQTFADFMQIHERNSPFALSPKAAAVMSDAPAMLPNCAVPILRVANARKALYQLARSARSRYTGKVIGVTGSSGKTSTVYALAKALQLYGGVEHSRDSGNVPRAVGRVIASMPLEIPFWVLELSMVKMKTNSELSKPDIAVVTSIFEAHLSDLKNLQGVAEQKSLIFDAMQPSAIAVLNRDMHEFDTVYNAALAKKLEIFTYGQHEQAHVRIINCCPHNTEIDFMGKKIVLDWQLPLHFLQNHLAVLICLHLLQLPLEKSIALLAKPTALPGRGRVFNLSVKGKNICLLDDSYNANTGSIAAALEHVSLLKGKNKKSIAFLGDIADLGDTEKETHLQLVPMLLAANLDTLVLCGPLMRHVYDALEGKIPGAWYPDAETLIANMPQWLCNEQVVLVKSSGQKLKGAVAQLLGEGVLLEKN